MRRAQKSVVTAIVDRILSSGQLRDVLANSSELIGQAFGVTSCVITVVPRSEEDVRPPLEWSLIDPSVARDNATVALSNVIHHRLLQAGVPLVIDDITQDSLWSNWRQEIEVLGVRSLIAAIAPFNNSAQATIILFQCDDARSWYESELQALTQISFYAGIAIFHTRQAERQLLTAPADVEPSVIKSVKVPLEAGESKYHRLVENSDAIIFSTDRDQRITFVSRRAMDFFGIAPEEFVARAPIRWFDLIHPDDRERIAMVAVSKEAEQNGVDDELRVINRITGEQRWLLVRLVPVHQGNNVVGWDGFGFDITARREAQEALIVQSKKVRALYTVSSAIRGFIEPVHIALRGLEALREATGADAGLCYLFSSKKPSDLQLVAHVGFSHNFTSQLESRSNFPNLSSYVATHGQAVVVPDVKSDPRARSELAEEEGINSAVIVPITAEDEILGAIGLFSKSVSRFDGGDVMLVSAAASQIGLAARQADLFTAYKRQTKHLAALYRMSHELSKNLSLDDIFFHAFSVIRDELGLKRLWLGLLNETGTRITGQAAYGPGLRRRLVDINVEISGRTHPIARAVRERIPVIIDNPDEVLKEFGVKRIFSRLAINSVVLVPLTTSGQILGVLTVQPGTDEAMLDEDGLALLRSLANEIAAVLLAKRFEERIAEGEKMRTAGLLAAGIAHNFNNMLQAILGQASLLEMQSESKLKVKRAAKLITEAASKGAGLVKHLMSFAQLEKPVREACDVNFLIERGVDAFSPVVNGERKLSLNLAADLPRAYVDPGQVRQIVSNLLLNAVDATPPDGEIHVSTEFFVVDDRSPHFEVPFGQYIRINIKDSGVGMDEDTRRRCFEPFFTTKNVDPLSGLGMSGSGLGLAAAYALARRNGGSLVVESRPGFGSLFTVYLPVAVEAIGAALQAQVEVVPQREQIEPVLPETEPQIQTRTKKGRGASVHDQE